MFNSNIILKMLGEEGYQNIQIPSNYQHQYPFITVANMTDNSISIYPPGITEPTAGLALYTWGAYQSMTVPITPEIQNGLNLVWTNPHETNKDKLKTAQVIFSKTNLGYNQSFAPSFAMGGNVLYTALVNDQVGLLTSAEFAAYISDFIGLINLISGMVDGSAPAQVDVTDFANLLSLISGMVDGSGPAKVLSIGTSFKQQLTQADAVAGVITFTDPISAIEIINTDAANAGVFSVNGININVAAGGSFKAIIGGVPTAAVTITGSTSYIVNSFS